MYQVRFLGGFKITSCKASYKTELGKSVINFECEASERFGWCQLEVNKENKCLFHPEGLSDKLKSLTCDLINLNLFVPEARTWNNTCNLKVKGDKIGELNRMQK